MAVMAALHAGLLEWLKGGLRLQCFKQLLLDGIILGLVCRSPKPAAAVRLVAPAGGQQDSCPHSTVAQGGVYAWGAQHG